MLRRVPAFADGASPDPPEEIHSVWARCIRRASWSGRLSRLVQLKWLG